jgi:hypothetical protein
MPERVADLTLRATGAAVADRARLTWDMASVRQRAILLIHGYNVGERAAPTTLNEFRAALGYFSPELPAHTFTCTWAGNWNIPVIRPAAYPFMLRNARESAEVLLQAITDWYARAPAPPEEFIIVAHSLGCRLVLEMLRAFAAGGRPPGMQRLAVVLMAAAVPTQHVDGGGALENAVTAADVRIVLHSASDSILSLVFGLGQTAGGDGWFPEAVGLRGRPQPGQWTRHQEMAAFDHGDYWGELETAETVCAMLGFRVRRSAVSGVPLATRKLLQRHRSMLASALPVGFGSLD